MESLDIIDAEVVEELHIDEPRTPRQQFLHELRGVLDLLEENPEIPLPTYIGSSVWQPLTWYPGNPTQAATIVRALGGKWAKNDPHKSEFDATYLRMTAKLGLELHVDLLVSREGICEKRVVGTEKRKVEKVVVAQVTEEVYENVEVVEFECKSIMSLADQKVMDELEAIAS